jgi:hypothetical protein
VRTGSNDILMYFAAAAALFCNYAFELHNCKIFSPGPGILDSPSEVKLPAHRAGLPGKERTRHDCALEYLRKDIIHPHLCPLPSRERKIKE